MGSNLNIDALLIRLRIRVLSPPPNVIFAVQKDKAELVQPLTADAECISFEIILRLRPSVAGAGFNFMGDFAQGPPQERFVYINSGARAGQSDTAWERRAKLKLGLIPESLVSKAAGVQGKAIEASFLGTASDGGPVCASLPTSAVQWRIVQSAA